MGDIEQVMIGLRHDEVEEEALPRCARLGKCLAPDWGWIWASSNLASSSIWNENVIDRGLDVDMTPEEENDLILKTDGSKRPRQSLSMEHGLGGTVDLFLVYLKLDGHNENLELECLRSWAASADARGSGGGLFLAWKNTCDVTVWSFSNNHIDVLFNHDSKGGLIRNKRQMESFRIVLGDCNLADVGYMGSSFTWEEVIEWIIISANAWTEMATVRGGLDAWFSRIHKENKLSESMLKMRLAELLNNQPTDDVLGTLDNNTTFFYHFASFRKHRNRIQSLRDDNGEQMEGEVALESLARDYFQSLFASQFDGVDERIIEGIRPCIIKTLNVDLLHDFSAKEVWQAVKSMGPLKAMGSMV
ncbi:hypothetical protein F3Y22_tig00111758pilonHSYRG00278 [Hibiscus syriacus]|uniref:Uncharacterized protein n=1 Tax=Hibiscus syriacus TaxID=106335 RepID=A0A6A2XF85_HIBSY|nr:hypothetical protein F3Y22_tig00111758pilonHSYRG00278 [Hibiscus syriacus]